MALFPCFFTRRDTGLEREELQLFEHSLGHTGEQESTSRLAHLLTVRPRSDWLEIETELTWQLESLKASISECAMIWPSNCLHVGVWVSIMGGKKKKTETGSLIPLCWLFHPNKKGHELIEIYEYNFKNLTHQGLHWGGWTLGIEFFVCSVHILILNNFKISHFQWRENILRCTFPAGHWQIFILHFLIRWQRCFHISVSWC